VDSLTAAPDLENSLSGSYVRGTMYEGSHAWALLAAAPSEDAATIENILAFGILRLDFTRTRAERRAIEGLRLFVPQGTSRRLRERLLALSASTRAEIYEMRDPDAAMQKIDLADAGNLESWLVPRDQIESALHAACETIARIRAMLPGNIDAIQCGVSAGAKRSRAGISRHAIRALDQTRSFLRPGKFHRATHRRKRTRPRTPAAQTRSAS
jgi:hypothetical protein